MAGIINYLFGKTEAQSATPSIRQSTTLHNPLERLALESPEAAAQIKKTEKICVDFLVHNWSTEIELPLFEVNVIPQTQKRETITAGRTYMHAAKHFYETSKGESRSDSSFRTMASVKGAYAIELVASKEEDGAIRGIYTGLMLWDMEHRGEPQEAIEKQAQINREYRAKHSDALKSQDNVFSDRICHLTESVKVHIDIHDGTENPKFPMDHALITVVSAKTEKAIAQSILSLEKPKA